MSIARRRPCHGPLTFSFCLIFIVWCLIFIFAVFGVRGESGGQCRVVNHNEAEPICKKPLFPSLHELVIHWRVQRVVEGKYDPRARIDRFSVTQKAYPAPKDSVKPENHIAKLSAEGVRDWLSEQGVGDTKKRFTQLGGELLKRNVDGKLFVRAIEDVPCSLALFGFETSEVAEATQFYKRAVKSDSNDDGDDKDDNGDDIVHWDAREVHDWLAKNPKLATLAGALFRRDVDGNTLRTAILESRSSLKLFGFSSPDIGNLVDYYYRSFPHQFTPWYKTKDVQRVLVFVGLIVILGLSIFGLIKVVNGLEDDSDDEDVRTIRSKAARSTHRPMADGRKPAAKTQHAIQTNARNARTD